MFRRSDMSGAGLLAHASLLLLISVCTFISPTANATAPTARSTQQSALGGFVKDPVIARILGETLFRDTVGVMSDSAAAATDGSSDPTPGAGPRTSNDNGAVGKVARTLLARRSLDRYLWLIRRAYDDTLWKGGDRARIEQHFPLIWRTSIMLYQATLNASPHRIRVCIPSDGSDDFDCHDEIERAKIVPIPSQTPIIVHPSDSIIG